MYVLYTVKNSMGPMIDGTRHVMPCWPEPLLRHTWALPPRKHPPDGLKFREVGSGIVAGL